ncbi:MAG: hypothetical protein JWM68_3845 [Verrucomicrobiales bacterium]|nr:hypothetical protein [Verrucomicrobiales bacterium]
MKNKTMTVAGLVAGVALGLILPSSFAGLAQKWDELPNAVKETILAKGGKEGGHVDKEGFKKDGKAVYEAELKDKDGVVTDLVITEDGKLIETKHDDAADKATEKADAAAKKGKKGKTAKSAKTNMTGVKFSHPRDITNPYLPLAYLTQDILEGKEGAAKVRTERTAKPDVRKTFTINGQSVEALVVEDRDYEEGQLAEVATDYFAQDDDGNVYYLGEDVDEIKDGKVIGHDGAWMLGKDTQIPGVLFPAHPQVGDKFESEAVSKEIHEGDEVISISETVVTPAGTYNNCVKIKETPADGKIEYKYFAPGVGVVREAPDDGDILMTSHKSTSSLVK